jgi:hypothetical protein
MKGTDYAAGGGSTRVEGVAAKMSPGKIVLVPGMPELAEAQLYGSPYARTVAAKTALKLVNRMGLRDECAHYFDGTDE